MNGQDIRYSRQASLAEVGASGQQKLADSSALLIGAGGLGTAASLYLATAGLGRLVINDFDTVDQ
ncbi:MAG: ThiF family adenylyltransferase, partial [Gammaproteobacteria bacterium]|nr:ThiF family adenylyltransferase [Gammaproteobacteria bacterium]